MTVSLRYMYVKLQRLYAAAFNVEALEAYSILRV